jgi:hypothetical protein
VADRTQAALWAERRASGRATGEAEGRGLRSPALGYPPARGRPFHPTAAKDRRRRGLQRSRPDYRPAVAALVEQLELRPGRICRLGAATGKLTWMLAPSGARIIALEPVASAPSWPRPRPGQPGRWQRGVDPAVTAHRRRRRRAGVPLVRRSGSRRDPPRPPPGWPRPGLKRRDRRPLVKATTSVPARGRSRVAARGAGALFETRAATSGMPVSTREGALDRVVDQPCRGRGARRERRCYRGRRHHRRRPGTMGRGGSTAHDTGSVGGAAIARTRRRGPRNGQREPGAAS